MAARRKAPAAQKAGGAASKRAPARSKRAPARAKRALSAIESARLDELVRRASAVRENAYAPYSGYRVGAAIATRSGPIFTGCNVENASYGGTICAERGAVMQMVAAGEREPIAAAVVTEDGATPCGLCRQVLAELADDLPIVVTALDGPEGETGKVLQLAELLPLAYKLRAR